MLTLVFLPLHYTTLRTVRLTNTNDRLFSIIPMNVVLSSCLSCPCPSSIVMFMVFCVSMGHAHDLSCASQWKKESSYRVSIGGREEPPRLAIFCHDAVLIEQQQLVVPAQCHLRLQLLELRRSKRSLMLCVDHSSKSSDSSKLAVWIRWSSCPSCLDRRPTTIELLPLDALEHLPHTRTSTSTSV